MVLRAYPFPIPEGYLPRADQAAPYSVDERDARAQDFLQQESIRLKGSSKCTASWLRAKLLEQAEYSN